MKRVAQLISFLALATILLSAVLFFADCLSRAAAQAGLLIATVVWFVATPFWMGRKAGP
jgi:hypothetical protein